MKIGKRTILTPSLRRSGAAALLALASMGGAGCTATGSDQISATASAADVDPAATAALVRQLSGRSATEGSELEKVRAAAAFYPLGTAENPVRAQGPAGQREYLSRLRCSDTSRPEFSRMGSAGFSPYGNIVDIYVVECDGAAPERSEIFIDMYHRGHVEREAVPGYGIAGGRVGERAAE